MSLLLGLEYAETLPPVVRSELDQLVAAIQTAFNNLSTALDPTKRPHCVAFHNTTQSIPDITITTLSLNSEDVDIGAMHDNGTNPSRVTIPESGFYLLHGSAVWASAGGNARYLGIYKNGSLLKWDTRAAVLGGSNTYSVVSSIAQLTKNDYLELVGYQDSGGAINCGSSIRGESTQLVVAQQWSSL